jgi:hypothetical protein
MRIEKTDLIVNNVLSIQMDLSEEDVYKGFAELEVITYQENIYKVGSVIYSMSEMDKNENTRALTFYTSVSSKPENIHYEFNEMMTIENTLLMRQADQEENLTAVRTKLSKIAKDEFGKTLADKTYCVCWDIYGEMIIDVYIEMI